MATKAQQAHRIMQKLHDIHLEAAGMQCELSELKRQMDHPTEEQIEQAALDGKEIVRGCTQDG